MTIGYEDLPRPIRPRLVLADPRLGIPRRVITKAGTAARPFAMAVAVGAVALLNLHRATTPRPEWYLAHLRRGDTAADDTCGNRMNVKRDEK